MQAKHELDIVRVMRPRAVLATLNYIKRHPLNESSPLRSLARFACWQIISRLRREVEFKWIADSKLMVRRGMTGATGNIYCGLREFTEMAFVLHLLRPGDLFLDIGSNIGSYTILASKVCGARTLAFEPDPDTHAFLQRNIALNGVEGMADTRVTALGDTTGMAHFTVGLGATNHIAGPGDVKVQEVPISLLDDFDCEPTLIKMDVEGYEARVLAGAEKTLARPSLLAVLIEGDEPAAVAILSRHGFKRVFYRAFERTLGGSEPRANGLYLRDHDAVIRRIESAPRRMVRGAMI